MNHLAYKIAKYYFSFFQTTNSLFCPTNLKPKIYSSYHSMQNIKHTKAFDLK